MVIFPTAVEPAKAAKIRVVFSCYLPRFSHMVSYSPPCGRRGGLPSRSCVVVEWVIHGGRSPRFVDLRGCLPYQRGGGCNFQVLACVFFNGARGVVEWVGHDGCSPRFVDLRGCLPYQRGGGCNFQVLARVFSMALEELPLPCRRHGVGVSHGLLVAYDIRGEKARAKSKSGGFPSGFFATQRSGSMESVSLPASALGQPCSLAECAAMLGFWGWSKSTCRPE
jgi:hypothetical protein